MTYTTTTTRATVDPHRIDRHTMALAAQVIEQGGLVAFPTETVYGLGADALNPIAVAQIFAAKQRPASDPLIVHIHAREQLAQVARNVPPIAHQLADAFWPGALTLVLAKHPDVPMAVTAGNDTIAVRMPDHPVARALLRKADTPIAAPSANRFSRPSATTADHVMQDLDGHVDVILDGGATTIGLESTIVDLVAPVPAVLRAGGISLEQLRAHLPTLAYRPRHIDEDDASASVPAPGNLLKHYSPTAQIIVYEGEQASVQQIIRETAEQYALDGQSVGILALDADALAYRGIKATIILLGADLQAMAATLFAGLRELDAAGVDVILASAPPQTGIGVALYDRLLRAAEGQMVTVDEH